MKELEKLQSFHISATGRSLNYLPQYVAQEKGFFDEADLHVTSDVPNPWPQVLKDIDTGRAAAALGGIWVPSMFYGKGRNYHAFCQLSARCPVVLMARHPSESFQWRALDGRVVLISGTGGSGSYVFLSGLARRAGFGVDRIRFIRDLDFEMLLDLFVGGLGDYMVVDVPTARRLSTDGVAQVVFDLAAEGGPVPWSVYYAPVEAIKANTALYARFTAAIQRAVDWIHGNPIAAFAQTARALWSAHEPDQTVSWLEHYKAAGMWNKSVEVEPGAFAIWQEMLATSGLIERPLQYSEIVSPLRAVERNGVGGKASKGGEAG